MSVCDDWYPARCSSSSSSVGGSSCEWMSIRINYAPLCRSGFNHPVGWHQEEAAERTCRRLVRGLGIDWQPMPGRATSIREQAGGHERVVVNVSDDPLLAGVVLHDVLTARVCFRRRLAFDDGIAVTVGRVAP